MLDNQILVQDEQPSFYIYKLSKDSKTQYGVIASVDINLRSKK